MLRNYILIAWRNFIKHRTYSLINITGFSLAMVSCFLIVFHIKNELSYEQNFPKYRNIYRVHPAEWAKSAPPTALALADYFPEIKSTTRLYDYGSRILSYDEQQFEVEDGFMADSSAIDMFSLEFVSGNPGESLRAPFTVVLTETLAKKLFRDADPVGRIIKVNNFREYSVTGIIRDFPESTHLRMSYLISFSTLYKTVPSDFMASRNWMGPYTYVELEPSDLNSLQQKLDGFRVKFYEGVDTPENILTNFRLEFQPMKDIHLYSHLEQEMGANSNAGYLYIFGVVAVFIIFIASVNFINLNISLAFCRLKETGMRKVMGALRWQLVRQYMTETLLISFFAFVIAMAIFFSILPQYNEMTGRTIQMNDVLTIQNFGVMAALIFSVSLISGLYPALFMSKFRPIESLKSQKGPGSSTSYVRKGLVVFQFAVSVFMIASTIVIYRQMNFFEQKQLGFDKEQVVGVRLYGELQKKFASDQQVVKSTLQTIPAIMHVGALNNLPGDNFSVEDVRPVGMDPNQELPPLRVVRGDHDWITTLNIQLVKGRKFSPEFNDSASFMLNETAVKALNLEHPIGSKIENRTFGKQGTVVGVIKDFHFSSLHNPIEPLAIEYDPASSRYLFIKLQPGEVQETIKEIENTLKKIEPSNLFSYSFIDDKWNTQYREEQKMSTLFNAFSLFMIGISCIGLFGLSAIAIETRKKEIGIRKVLGASSLTIIRILSADSIVMVLLGSAIALPLAWHAMNQWLARFAFKISVTADVFVMALVIAMLVAFGSVLYNALKAVMANPVNSLRIE